MEYYDSKDAVKNDVLQYLDDNDIDLSEFDSEEQAAEEIYDKCFVDDAVTDNASGSYTFNRCMAKEFVVNNMDLLNEMVDAFGYTPHQIGMHFLNNDWEILDVMIRCYVLYGVVEDVVGNGYINKNQKT